MRASSSSGSASRAPVVLGAILLAAIAAGARGDSAPPARRPVFNLINAAPLIARLQPDEPARLVIAADDARLAVLDARGFALPGWPLAIHGRFAGSPVAADLDGDHRDEIYASTDGRGILRFDERGDSLFLEMPEIPPAGIHFLAPLAADVTGDGRPELVSAATEGLVAVWRGDGHLLPGWPRKAGAPLMGQCFVADVDGAPGGEIIAGDSAGMLHVWNLKGVELPGWPITLASPVRVSAGALVMRSGPAHPLVATFDADGWLRAFDPHAASLAGWPAETRGLVNEPFAVADLDRDGLPEVVVTHREGTIMVVHSDGVLDPRWPRDARGAVRFGPLVADVTGDGAPEILVATDDRQIWAFAADGTEVPGWPRDLPAVPAARPVAGDLDGDGRNEVVLAVESGELLVFETDGLAAAASGKQASDSLRLWQNLPSRNAYENAIEITVPKDAPPVTLDLVDASGERAALLLDAKKMPPGRSVIMNPGKSRLPRVPPGGYTARLIAGTDTLRTEILVLR